MTTAHTRRTSDDADAPLNLQALDDALKRHLERQDKNLEELRALMIARNAMDDDIRPALHEMALLWKASKIMIPFLVVLAGSIWAFIAWSKDHLKI